MLENIKKRIIHFYTHGNIIEDFVEARRRKAAWLRRVIRACFYIQCALAACCIAAALLMRAGGASAVVVGSLAVCIVAFAALGGGTAEKTVLYILDLVYAVICFIARGLGASPAFTVCGAFMLLSAAAALGGFFAAWCRQYLLDFSPARLKRGDYTRLGFSEAEEPPRQSAAPAPAVQAPPPPPKSEMEALAEKLSDILGSMPDIKTAPQAAERKPVSDSAITDSTEERPEAALEKQNENVATRLEHKAGSETDAKSVALPTVEAEKSAAEHGDRDEITSDGKDSGGTALNQELKAGSEPAEKPAALPTIEAEKSAAESCGSEEITSDGKDSGGTAQNSELKAGGEPAAKEATLKPAILPTVIEAADMFGGELSIDG